MSNKEVRIMISQEELLERLERLGQEIQELKEKVIIGIISEKVDETELFLRKCSGWQDSRSPDEVIAEIYAARSTGLRGSRAFNEP